MRIEPILLGGWLTAQWIAGDLTRSLQRVGPRHALAQQREANRSSVPRSSRACHCSTRLGRHPLHVATATALATEQSAPAGGKGNLATLLGDRHIRLGLLVLATANLTMVGMMAVAPVHLHAHGVGLGIVGLLVSVHIAAMYLPSPVTGWLSDTLGAGVMAGVGMLLLLGAGVLAAVRSTGQVGTMGALLLLGVGWDASLIAGSALLRDAHVDPSLRTRAEGLGELGMGAAAAAGGSAAGLLLVTGGFALLGLVAAVPCLLVLAVVATVGRSRMGILGGMRWSGSASAGRSPAPQQRRTTTSDTSPSGATWPKARWPS